MPRRPPSAAALPAAAIFAGAILAGACAAPPTVQRFAAERRLADACVLFDQQRHGDAPSEPDAAVTLGRAMLAQADVRVFARALTKDEILAKLGSDPFPEDAHTGGPPSAPRGAKSYTPWLFRIEARSLPPEEHLEITVVRLETSAAWAAVTFEPQERAVVEAAIPAVPPLVLPPVPALYTPPPSDGLVGGGPPTVVDTALTVASAGLLRPSGARPETPKERRDRLQQEDEQRRASLQKRDAVLAERDRLARAHDDAGARRVEIAGKLSTLIDARCAMAPEGGILLRAGTSCEVIRLAGWASGGGFTSDLTIEGYYAVSSGPASCRHFFRREARKEPPSPSDRELAGALFPSGPASLADLPTVPID